MMLCKNFQSCRRFLSLGFLGWGELLFLVGSVNSHPAQRSSRCLVTLRKCWSSSLHKLQGSKCSVLCCNDAMENEGWKEQGPTPRPLIKTPRARRTARTAVVLCNRQVQGSDWSSTGLFFCSTFMWWFQITASTVLGGFHYEGDLEKDDVFNVEKWEPRGKCCFF